MGSKHRDGAQAPETCAPEVRGPHEVRTARMRARLIQGAIECLYGGGYSSATTLNVQRRAGVSRGALLHHFSTRADLLIAVAEHIIAEQTAFYIDELERIGDARERYVQITAIAWEALKKPSGMALLEILMGCRRDPEMSERFSLVAREVTRFQRAGMWILAKNAGLSDRAAVIRANDLCLGALRGLSVQRLYDDDPQATERGVEMLLAWLGRWLDEAVPAGDERAPREVTPFPPLPSRRF